MAGESVTDHYARVGRLAPRILELAAAATGGARPSAADLAAFDQLHPRGREATDEVADLVEWRGLARFLDLGCGLGGPARYLAETRGVPAVGIDLTESFCADARALAEATGTEAVFACADATRLPFADASFPLVLTQAASMNIPDKAALYREVARVLAPGGRFLLHDVQLGPAEAPRFPVPWASEPANSHLLPPAAIRGLIEAAGLACRRWDDRTAEVRAGIEAQRRRAAELKAAGRELPPGAHTLQGPEFREMAANLARNLAEGRIVVTTGLFERPA
ncbi:Methyltransferase domain-containing protein [Tistlia consotensis]|uniref:Methyltransferase domain-containing protein n=1 Tax=Tistlia consotensis USBA 355 TaxID=560819 RepID=A0A1Y6B9Y7_9PROT|nr:class I SAM-dependent methyltransferase [Tistlia consotensis]SME89378.1 Methyltransferase domain-containing protein [Tistlia consotensis USBA 355]SNR25929.1 Methyltransferase domain-containing protein [Tistlia consotensis]